MGEFYSVVTRKGQITLPIEIRRALGIKEGDRVELSLGKGDQALVILRPVRSVAEATFGAVAPRKQPEDFQELRRAFEGGVAQEALEEMSRSEEH